MFPFDSPARTYFATIAEVTRDGGSVAAVHPIIFEGSNGETARAILAIVCDKLESQIDPSRELRVTQFEGIGAGDIARKSLKLAEADVAAGRRPASDLEMSDGLKKFFAPLLKEPGSESNADPMEGQA